ncbi:MAG: hypothetical protein ABSE86_02840 [Bryobacteraceae bacterium]|jgi:hypothetical protein
MLRMGHLIAALICCSSACIFADSIPVMCPANTLVGNITVNVVVNGQGVGGLLGDFTSTIPNGNPTLAAAATACGGGTQFNWFQVVMTDNMPPEDAGGKVLKAPFVDPPPGGYGGDAMDPGTWADNLPWYYDMYEPNVNNFQPKNPKATQKFDPDLQLSNKVGESTLSYEDAPTSPAANTSITFTTCLVDLNANGSFASFDGGFTWSWSNGNNKGLGTPEITSMDPDCQDVYELNGGNGKPILSGFATSVPEPSFLALLASAACLLVIVGRCRGSFAGRKTPLRGGSAARCRARAAGLILRMRTATQSEKPLTSLKSSGWRILTPVRGRFVLPLAVFLALPHAALSQAPEIRASGRVSVDIESGHLGNPEPKPALVFFRIVSAPGQSAWIRLHFDNVQLEDGSYLQITSLGDGDTQTLNAQQLEGWNNSTAYFNGWEVMVELYAGPGTRDSHFHISEAEVSARHASADARTSSPAAPDTSLDSGKPHVVCSQTDPRSPSFGQATNLTARLIGEQFAIGETPPPPLVCTASLAACPVTLTFANASREFFLTAGHCFNDPKKLHLLPLTVAQFDVPQSSNADCTLKQPPAASQFTIIPGTIQTDTSGDASGDDWAVFNVMRSGANNQQTPFQQRGGAWTVPVLLNGAPPTGTAAMVGYGSDGGPNNIPATGKTRGNFCGPCDSKNTFGTSTLNHVAQIAFGTVTSVNGSEIFHDIASCGGNSGSPIYDSIQDLFGIQKGAVGGDPGNLGCKGFDRTNRATGVNNGNLKAAVTFACTVCDVNMDGKVNNADLQMIQAALGQAAKPGDLRDPNRDGIINIEDLRICSMLCTNPNCN